ncbi:asparaginase [uncultured Herbaspirillum sp.]|uniref:asparaginase n=1 Tax=uncultured Herbaspirillum sp. TaxID=160236 RepID=UPI00258B6064|nr:asparaginase [uncultured Herbaspirillum sp.]
MIPALFLLATGGTITMVAQPGGGITPALRPEQLVQAVPGLAGQAVFSVHAYASLPGASLTLGQLCEMATILNARLAGDTAGAIVVQGTDTIEETAFVLDLLVKSHKPVVVTGAMRGPQAAGADGPANLLAAAIVASSPAACQLGCLVVLNDEVHAARFVQKQHTVLPSAFQSPNQGPLGWVVESAFQRNVRLARGPQLDIATGVEDFPVALIKLALGDDGRLLPGLPELGFRGVVIEAMGAGHVPAAVARNIDTLCARLPVVLCSRVTSGPILRNTYGFVGSEIDLIRRGVIPGGRINAVKSCLLLRLALANGLAHAALAQLFQQVGDDCTPH